MTHVPSYTKCNGLLHYHSSPLQDCKIYY